LKNKLIRSQNDYKGLLEKFETFANLNCELSTKIEQLESSAPSTATDDSLIKKNEKLKAMLASSQEAIENLLGKMKILSIHNDELTTKLENIGSTPEVFLIEIPAIIKKDASTSYFDLIDDSNPCSQVLVKNVVIETCSDEIAMENEQLKQDVARLGKALYDKKAKAKQIQPPQDNTIAGVNKPVEGETVICRLCHKEGHMSFQCKAKTGDKQKQKLKKKRTSKISNTYINKVDKKSATPYLIKKKKNGKVIAIKASKQANKGKGAKRIWVPKEIISTMKSTKKVWILRGKWGVRRTSGNLETWQIWDVYHGMLHIGSSLLPSGLVYTLDPNSPPMTKVTRFIVFLVFRYAYLFSCI
jgi:FtsZ-binding cell division protein ZapB